MNYKVEEIVRSIQLNNFSSSVLMCFNRIDVLLSTVTVVSPWPLMPSVCFPLQHGLQDGVSCLFLLEGFFFFFPINCFHGFTSLTHFCESILCFPVLLLFVYCTVNTMALTLSWKALLAIVR